MDYIPFLTIVQSCFILFLFPLIGQALSKYLHKKTAWWILGISFFFLIPMFTPWDYPFPFAYRTLGLIFASVAYALRLQSSKLKRETNGKISMILSATLFFVLGFAAFVAALGGSQQVEHTWKNKNYRVQLLHDQGFSGRAISIYTIGKYTAIPILVRDMETVVELDTTNSCVLHFKKSNIYFNRCDGSIIPAK